MGDSPSFLLWLFGIVGVGLFLLVVVSEAVARGIRLDRERRKQEEESHESHS